MIHYACICRGATIICSQQKPGAPKNFEDIVSSMIPNIPTDQDKRTSYTSDNYTFHCNVDCGILFLCVADSDMGKPAPHSCLAEIKKHFQRGNYGSRAVTASSHELDQQFGNVLIQEMDRFSKPGNAGGAMGELQSQVEEVKGILTQNIEKVMERGDRLDDLMDKTYELEEQSIRFQKTSRKVRTRFWWKNLKMKIIMVCVAVIVVLVLILIILFSTGVLPVKSDSTTPAPATSKPYVGS